MTLPIRVFIASSSEHLDVANTIRNRLLRGGTVDPKVWNEGTFKLSKTYIESLEGELQVADFAVLTLTSDDVSIARREVRSAPRDNVLFELGLFMGRLGRDRCLLVMDKAARVKIPSDLLGIKISTYRAQPGHSLSRSLQAASTAIMNRVLEQGARPKTTVDTLHQRKRIRRFCARVKGAWWQRKVRRGKHSLSFSQFVPDEVTHTLRTSVASFNDQGRFNAEWRSLAVGVQLSSNTVWFSWEGSHPITHPGEPFGGFGEMRFDDAPGLFTHGRGRFADIRGVHLRSGDWRTTELRRITKSRDVRTMTTGSDSEKRALLDQTLREW